MLGEAVQVGELPRGIYLLLLLNAENGEAVRDRTRLEKLVFLISKEVLDKPGRRITQKTYTFQADRFGPFTEEVYDDVLTLTDLGLATWDEKQELVNITEKGKSLASKLLAEKYVSYALAQDIERIKKHYNRTPLKTLLRYVYQTYEKYTYESEIREEILGK
jgi:uncharacterized protein YwgA